MFGVLSFGNQLAAIALNIDVHIFDFRVNEKGIVLDHPRRCSSSLQR